MLNLPTPAPGYDANNEAQTRRALQAEDGRNVKTSDYATVAKRGVVKVDGVTIVAAADGTIGAGAVALLVASENIAAGAIVNVHSVSGAAQVRNASATDGTRPAHGFMAAAVTSGDSATVYFGGQLVTGLTGLTPGAVYYLDVSGGAINTTAPSTAGNVIQEVGVALGASSLLFNPAVKTDQL